LELAEPGQLRPARTQELLVRLERALECPSSFYRYLYREVGRRYHWVDRLGWTDAEIGSHLADPDVSLWVLYLEGSPAGYFELRRCDDASVEIAYFGLLPEFLGRGLGKHLLTVAVEAAWSSGANRVWLHTCTLDDQAAMPNYLNRGFIPFKTETYVTNISPEEEAYLQFEA
jgi:GNAT superfamily N-acetyltransferase